MNVLITNIAKLSLAQSLASKLNEKLGPIIKTNQNNESENTEPNEKSVENVQIL